MTRDRASPADGAWLTLGQAAKYLGISESTLRKWADAGRLPAFSTPGGHRRFRTGDLDVFLDDARVDSDPGGTVLVLSDDSHLNALVRLGLERDGHRVQLAATPRAATAILEKDPPDVVFLDLGMHELDALDFLCRLRDRHSLDTVAVIVFGGNAGGVHPRRLSTVAGNPDPLTLVESAQRLLSTRARAA